MAKIIILDLLRWPPSYAKIAFMTEVIVSQGTVPQQNIPAVEESGRDPKALMAIRLLWRELDGATNQAQVMAVLAKVTQASGGEPLTVQLELPVQVYTRIMNCAWLAKQLGQIEEMSMHSYIDRAMQLMEYNLKTLYLRGNV
jgi:hypothetical protein